MRWIRPAGLLVAVLVVSSLFLPLPSRAELVALGEAFEVASTSIAPPPVDPGPFGFVERSQPSVVALPNGFAIAWTEEVYANEVRLSSLIEGRIVSPSGSLGLRFSSPGIHESQRVFGPILSSLPNGRFLLTAAQDREQAKDLWIQSWSAAAVGSTPKAVENPQLSVYNDLPSASAVGGRSALAWLEAFQGDAPPPRIPPEYLPPKNLTFKVLTLGQGSTTPVASVRLEPGLPEDRTLGFRPAVSIDRAGRFFVVWPENYGLFAQRFKPTGVAFGPRFEIAHSAVGGVALARAADGSMVVAWAEAAAGGAEGVRVVLARYTAAGKLVGTPRALGNFPGFTKPVLALDATNNTTSANFALVWIDGERLRAQHLGADLAPRGTAVERALAPSEFGTAAGVSIGAALRKGELLVTWAGDMPDGFCPTNPIVAQRWSLR